MPTEKKPEIVMATVARGRSIQVDDRIYIEGEEVPVPAAELEHMRQGGFIHDPDEPPVVRTVPRAPDNPTDIGHQFTIDH